MTREAISLSAHHPAAPPGQRNVAWQADASRRDNPVFSAHVRNTAGVRHLAEDYTATAADNGYLLVFSSDSDATLALPAPAPASGSLSPLFPSPALSGSDNWAIGVSNLGGASVMVTANGCRLDRATAPVTLKKGQSLGISTDGSDFYTTRGGGAGGGGPLITEVPAGTLDGANTVFTLSRTPDPGSLQIFVNGVEWYEGLHYTVDGSTIHFVLAPKSTDWLRATYTSSS